MSKNNTLALSTLAALLLLAAACGSRDPLARQDCFGAAGISTTHATPSCAEGSVYFKGACTPRESLPANAAFTCEPQDEPGCTTQCQRGDGASCDRLAEIILGPNDPNAVYGLEPPSGPNEDTSTLSPRETTVFASVKPLIKRMEEACNDGGAPSACVAAAAGVSLRDDKDDLPQTGPTLTTFAALMERACRDGHNAACVFNANLYTRDTGDNERYGEHAITRNARKLEGILIEGCDTGSAKACFMLANFAAYPHIGIAELEREPNGKQAARLWSASCLGGVLNGCIYATAAFITASPQECTTFFKDHLVKTPGVLLCLGVPCAPDDTDAIETFCKLTAGLENKKTAYFTASKVCGDDDAVNARLCKTAETLGRFAAEP